MYFYLLIWKLYLAYLLLCRFSFSFITKHTFSASTQFIVWLLKNRWSAIFKTTFTHILLTHKYVISILFHKVALVSNCVLIGLSCHSQKVSNLNKSVCNIINLDAMKFFQQLDYKHAWVYWWTKFLEIFNNLQASLILLTNCLNVTVLRFSTYGSRPPRVSPLDDSEVTI